MSNSPGRVLNSLKCSCAFLGALAAIFALGTWAFGESRDPGGPRVELTPIRIQTGPQFSWGMCPCFRWVVQVQGLGGRIETRDWLITADSLLSFHQEAVTDFQRYEVRMFRAGALEALWKGGHVGMGFEGVTWGEDRDRGYSDILRTGLYLLANLIRTESVRLDIHSGADFDHMRINLGEPIDRALLRESANLKWRAGAWSAAYEVFLSQDASHLLDAHYLDYGGTLAQYARLARFGDLAMSLGLSVSAEHEGFRTLFGLQPNGVSGMLVMDLSYVTGVAGMRR